MLAVPNIHITIWKSTGRIFYRQPLHECARSTVGSRKTDQKPKPAQQLLVGLLQVGARVCSILIFSLSLSLAVRSSLSIACLLYPRSWADVLRSCSIETLGFCQAVDWLNHKPPLFCQWRRKKKGRRLNPMKTWNGSQQDRHKRQTNRWRNRRWQWDCC